MQIIVAQSVVPLLLCPPVNAVTLHIAYHVLGIIEPVALHIAFCKPCTRLAIDGGLSLVQARHIRKGGGGLVEGAFVEL